MLEELDLDLEAHAQPVVSKTLTQVGLQDYPELMRRAISDHDEVWLTERVNEEARVAPERVDAARRLAQTGFNRYYMRGICRRAEQHSSATVIPYRAHQPNGARRGSILSEGKPQSGSRILAKLRGKAMLGDPERGLAKVNSGLSVRCGCGECAKAAR